MAQVEHKHDAFNMEMSDYYKAKRDIPRFDKCITTKSNAIRFFRNCAIMGQHKGLILNPLKTMQEYQWGLQVSFQYKNTQYHSIYIYYTKPDQKPIDTITKYILDNLDKNWLIFKNSGVDSNTIKQIYSTSSSTSKTPNIISGSDEFNISSTFIEYDYICKYYGDKVTDRTGIHMINHIDEGLFILNKINASDDAKRAYIIHPLVQSDPDLNAFCDDKCNGIELVNKRVLLLAVEYRNIANAHLSFHESGIDSFKLSPLKEVNDMLIADKIQNRKDFELFHDGKHSRSQKLKTYFKEWLKKLNISEDRFNEIRNELINNTGGHELSNMNYEPKMTEKETDIKDLPGFNQVSVRNRKNIQSSDNAKWMGLFIGIVIGFGTGYGFNAFMQKRKN